MSQVIAEYRRSIMLTRIIIFVALLLSPSVLIAQNSKQELNDQMWEAARRGDVAAVTAMLDKGADVNAKFRYGATALFKAAERGNTEVVKLLLARGADPTIKDTFYQATAMTWALSQKHVDVVRLLLEKDPTSVNEVLMTGVREGNPGLVRVALDRGVDKRNMTAALAAAQNSDEKNPEILEMLKKAGAEPPIEVDSATLQSYAGKYKSEQGFELTIIVKDGRLIGTAQGQPPLALMAIDKTTFRPTAFDGVSLVFNVESGKTTSMALKQGATTTQMKRVEETKP
jgi:ankyrin repeat protein